MRRTRWFLFALLLCALTTVGLVTGTSSQTRKSAPPQKPPKQATTDRIIPKPGPDPSRATQSELDAALFQTEDFLGATARVPRPYAPAREALTPLLAKYPKDARLLRQAASLDEKLGLTDRAVEEMRQYVAVRNDAPNALRRLAAFYHQRALFTDEARTLQKLAPAALPFEREAIYTRVAQLAKDQALTDFDLAEFYRQALAADPGNIKLIEPYVDHLTGAKKFAAALRLLDDLQPKYPDQLRYFLKTRAAVHERQGKRREAEAVYADAFDPLWSRPIVADYYDLLRRIGRYRAYKRGLLDAFWKGGKADLATAARLFNVAIYEGNDRLGMSVVEELEKRRGARDGWQRTELETLSAMCLQIGRYDQASRFLYSLYVSRGLTPGTAEREGTLANLAAVLLDAGDGATPLAAGDLAFYRDIAKVDVGAGFLNGVLSLVLAGGDVPSGYKTAETASVAYFNRALAYRFYSALRTEFADSGRIPDLHAKLLDAFAAMGEFETVVRLGDEYLARFPRAKNYDEVMWKIADAERSLKRTEAERKRLLALLDRKGAERKPGEPLMPVSPKRWTYQPDGGPTESDDGESTPDGEIYDPSDQNAADGISDSAADEEYLVDYLGNETAKRGGITYQRVLDRVIADSVASATPQETLKFLYGEIKKYPREEGLYERLLKWLGQTSLVDEQLTAYTQAVRRFGSNTWYHRLARWFVRNDRREAFEKYSRELAEVLDDGDLGEYFQRFITNANPSNNENDARLYLELYKFAHDRFPTNPEFVKGLLNYYKLTGNWNEWEALSARYYFADQQIRADFVQYLARTDRLRSRFDSAKGKPGATYRWFSADAAMWLSHHDEAVAAYRDLVTLYPGEPRYAERLANMLRSFGRRDPAMYEEAARTWTALAAVYPTNHAYPTQAGEVFAELSDFKRAGAQWDSILAKESGKADTYLEVASIYWDYFQYDDALRVIGVLRRTTGDAQAYAYQAGALHEGKQQPDKAIEEYVAVLGDAGDTRDKAIERLRQLTPRRDFATRIARAYAARKAAVPGDGQLVLGYARYLREIEKPTDAARLLMDEVMAQTDLDFLEAARSAFHADRQTTEEGRTIERMLAVARDEREAMKYRLQLAAFNERQGKVDAAVAVVDRLVTDFPTNLGVLQEASQFYWRVGLLDKSIGLYQRTTGTAVGQYRRQFTLQLARRQREAGKFADAEKTLRAWYADNPLDTDAFSLLAKVLGEAGQNETMATLYRDGLKNIAQANLDRDTRATTTRQLRLGYIDTLTALKRFGEGVDQYIEIVNRSPEDAELLGAAIKYASRYGEIPRLTAYYTDLAKKSDRNYRWNVVLGEIAAFSGDTATAAEQYRLATVNEPQRLEFRARLAGLYERLGRIDDALAVLKRAAELDSSNPEWLVAQARIYLNQPDGVARAVALLREAAATRRQTSAETLFSYGRVLLDRGLVREAATFYADGIAKVKAAPAKDKFDYGTLREWSRIVILTESPLAALAKFEDMLAALSRIAGDASAPGAESARSLAELVTASLQSDFPPIVRAYATSAQLADLDAEFRKRIAALRKNTPDELLAALGEFAERMPRYGLSGATEAALIRAKDVAFGARQKPEDTRYADRLRQVLAFYDAREDFAREIALLEAEEKRDRFAAKFDYPGSLAECYRKAGDAAREIEALGRFYRTQAGDITGNESPAVGRYLTLLAARNDRAELERLASMRSPYQIQLINFLVKRREKELARKAIASSGLSAAWIGSRSAQLALYFRDKSPEVEKLFTQVLATRPIGEKIGKRPDAAAELVGPDWFVTARNYGIWLTLDPNREPVAREYLVAETEAAPKSEVAQRALADFHRRAKRYDQARTHVQLARELAPEDTETMAVAGAIAFETGDRPGAVATWKQMLEPRRNRSTNYRRYLDVMIEHGLLVEALPAVEQRVAARIVKDDIDPEDWMQLVRAITTAAKEQPALRPKVTESLLRVLAATPDDLTLGLALLDDGMLAKEQEPAIYRVVMERVANGLFTALSNGSLSDPYLDGLNGYETLDRMQRAWLDRLIADRAYPEAEREARAMADTRRSLMDDVELRKKEGDYFYTDFTVEPEWLVMAQAVIELRTNRAPQAVERLRRFIGAATGETQSDESDGPVDAHLHAYALLVNENRQADADALLDEYYQSRLNDVDQTPIQAGLAEIDFRRGRTAEAVARLKRLAEGDARGLTAAAETAARYGQFAQAAVWRAAAMRLTPLDAANRIELARCTEKAGDPGKALTVIRDAVTDRNLTNVDRLTALEQLGEIARRNQAAVAPVAAALQGLTDEYSQAALALLLEASGDGAGAQTLLDRTATAPYAVAARLTRAGVAARARKSDVALTSLLDAYRDSLTSRPGYDGADGDSPSSLTALRLRLTESYFDAGRIEGALRFVEQLPRRSADKVEVDSFTYLTVLPNRRSTAYRSAVAELRDREPVVLRRLYPVLIDELTRRGEYGRAASLATAWREVTEIPADRSAITDRIAALNTLAERAGEPSLTFGTGLTTQTESFADVFEKAVAQK